MDIGVEVHMVNLGGLLARAVQFRDPRLMLQTPFPQRHLVICVAKAKLRTTLVKIFVQPRTGCVRNSFRPAIAICMLQGKGDVEYCIMLCVYLSR